MIFAKWRAAAERPATARRSGAESRAGTWIGLAALAACAWGYRYFSGSVSLAENADAGSTGSVSAKELPAERDSQGQFTAPSDYCGFEGRVMDVAALVPLPGAVIYMDAYKATADASGRYSILVRAISGDCEPFPSASHPDYQKNYWTRLFENADAEDRFALRGKTVEHERIKGKAGKVLTVDFSLFPKKIPASLLSKIAANADNAADSQ